MVERVIRFDRELARHWLSKKEIADGLLDDWSWWPATRHPADGFLVASCKPFPQMAEECNIRFAPMPVIRSGRPTPPKRTFPYALWLAGLGRFATVCFWASEEQ
jgi:hypothetical protein